MKTRLLFLVLLFSFGMYGQNPTKFEKIKITANTQDNGVARILVQDATTGEVKWILKSILDGKFNQPTGNSTQYLDGAGNPTAFPTLNQADRVVAEVRNETGATVTKGTVVYLNGASGGKALIQKAQANAELTSSGTFGVIQSDINNNANGYAVIIGSVTGLNTSSYTAGNVLWLSPTIAGSFTTTKPSAPNHVVYVGIVTASSTNQGTIEVKIQNGYELDELHNVSIASNVNNDALIYDSATGLWKNKQIVTDAIVDGTTTVAPSQNAVFDALATKEPTIASGTTSQYYRGDKTWQTLDKTAVGLSNVDNTSDLNKPISTATQTALNAKENTANKNTANGYAGLGSDGKLISNQLPAITITDTFVVGSQSSMLALTAETGDVAVRTDLSKSYILKGSNPAVLGDWQELLSPVDGVTSVFGRVGSVVANTGDYTTAQVTETTNKKYQTDAQALYNDATSSIQTQLNAKEPFITAPGTVGSYWRGNKTWATLDTSVIPENGSLFFTNDRAKIAVTGNSGSINYVSKFTSNGTIGNSQIFDNGTNVGIGTATPSSIVHIVKGGGAKINFGDSKNTVAIGSVEETSDSAIGFFTQTTTERMRIASSGNVGIGINTPSYKLSLVGEGVMLGLTAGNDRFATAIGSSNVFNVGQRLDFYTGDTGANGTPLGSSNIRMSILPNGNVGIGTITPTRALHIVGGDGGSGSHIAHFEGRFGAVGMYVRGDGSVGIGTTAPSSILTVGGTSGPATTPTAITMDGTYRTGGNAFDKLKFYLFKSSTESYGLGLADDSDMQYWAGTTSTGNHKFFTSQLERMRISANGNVAIGDVTGAYKFYVNGGQYGTILKGGDLGIGSEIVKFAKADGSLAMFVRGDGNVGIANASPSEKLTVGGNVLAAGFFQSSDLRLKDIISRDGDVIKYKWKDKRDDKIHIGYVAQEVQKENPDQVNADDKGILSVNYIEILVEKIRKLEKEIELLKAK